MNCLAIVILFSVLFKKETFWKKKIIGIFGCFHALPGKRKRDTYAVATSETVRSQNFKFLRFIP
jgi:hypothetical protein